MTQAPAAAPQPVKTMTLRWVLIASLAVNLAVGGLVVGTFLKGGPGGHDLARDMGFGPFDMALRPQDRDALKVLLRARAGNLKSIRAETLADLQRILAALRADPFEVATLDTAFSAQQDHLMARIQLGNQTMLDFLASLSVQERLDFADRLEERLSHGKDDLPPPPKG